MSLLAGCSSVPSAINPVTWWHDLQGGKIADERPAPPGANDPYPNLATVPPKPEAPDRAALQAISDGLIADRAHAQYIAAANPLSDPSSATASPGLFGKGTVPPPGAAPPPPPAGAAGAAGSPPGTPPGEAPPANAPPPAASATLPAASAPPPPPAAPPAKAPVGNVQTTPLAPPGMTAEPPAEAAAAPPPLPTAPPPPANLPGAVASAPPPRAAPPPPPPAPAPPPPVAAVAPPPPPAAAPPAPPAPAPPAEVASASPPAAAPPAAPAPAPPPAPPPAAAPAAPAPNSANMVNVIFAAGSATLPPSSNDTLRGLAGRRGASTIAVIGYGDAASSDPVAQSTALTLGLSRAQAIAAALTAAGVPATAIQLDAQASGRGGAARLIQ